MRNHACKLQALCHRTSTSRAAQRGSFEPENGGQPVLMGSAFCALCTKIHLSPFGVANWRCSEAQTCQSVDGRLGQCR